MVDAGQQPQATPQEVRAAFKRVCPVEIVRQDPVAHASPRALVRLTELRDQEHERADEVIERAVALMLAALADAAVVGVDVAREVM